MAITLIHDDAAHCAGAFDLILTDPPFDLPGKKLANILSRFDAPHLVLITSMQQFIEYFPLCGYDFCFDFVLDQVTPKKAKSIHAPNYTHSNGFYLRKKGTKSAFNRKLRERSDVFDNSGYWPTVLRAPRQAMGDHGQSKNEQAIIGLLGSFEIKNVVDPFAGSGTVGLAAAELGLDCTLIELDAENVKLIRKNLKFLGVI